MNNKMKVIFLDIDGVLNSQLWYSKRRNFNTEAVDVHYPFYEFDPDAIICLNRIIKETGAKLIISSTWRKNRTIEELQELLNSVGVEGEVIDKTPVLSLYEQNEYKGNAKRGNEIDYLLKNIGKFQRINWCKDTQQEYIDKAIIKNYIILDDDSDMLYSQREHFIQTTIETGLDNKIADKAIEILNKTLIELYY